MSILSGFLKVKRRRLTDEGYITQSEWTSASTVEHADGKTTEEKVKEIEDKISENTSVKIDSTLSIEGQAADAKAVGEAITVRYNSEGYLEVLVDGVWKQIEVNADTSGSVLFNAEKGNVANFVLYNGATNNQTNNYFGGNLTLDIGDTLVYKGTWTDYWACGCIISDPIDLTNYTKLIFNYSTKATIAKNYTFMNAFVVTTKQQSMTSVAHKVILNPSTTGQSGVAEIDLTNITGYQYIGFEMSCGNGTVTFELIEAHLE